MRSKKSWLSRFSTMARWYLPPEEAEEVIGDYTEMLSQDSRAEEALEHDLGAPRKAAAVLAQKKDYSRWLVVFLILALCVMFPALSILPRGYWIQISFENVRVGFPIQILFLLAGGLMALVWFRPRGRIGKKKIPWSLFLLLGLELLCMAMSWYLGWEMLRGYGGQFAHWLFSSPAYTFSLSGVVRILIEDAGLWAALIALYGLWKARCESRRWRAVYVLGLTALIVHSCILSTLHSMSLDVSSFDWRPACLRQWLALTLAGLVGTGVGLC